MKDLPKNIPAGLIIKACKHLKNAEQHLLTGHFSNDDYENREKIKRKYESI